jgi:hypothetical protein
MFSGDFTMKNQAVAVFSALIIVGCAGSPQWVPVQMQSKFVGAEHDVYKQTGAGSIKGQGFLRQQGGGTVTCAGSRVILMPATPYFREYFGLRQSGRDIGSSDKPDPAYKTILKESQCDAQGNFAFTSLPTATWLVATEVKWTVSNLEQGGTLLREVTSRSGESIQVLLTDNDLIGR